MFLYHNGLICLQIKYKEIQFVHARSYTEP